jgi:hypothetical protein
MGQDGVICFGNPTNKRIGQPPKNVPGSIVRIDIEKYGVKDLI